MNNTEAHFPLQNMFIETKHHNVKLRPTVNFPLMHMYSQPVFLYNISISDVCTTLNGHFVNVSCFLTNGLNASVQQHGAHVQNSWLSQKITRTPIKKLKFGRMIKPD